MNKSDLVSAVATASGLTKADSEKSVDGVFDTITAALKSGEKIQIAASKQPKFSAGKGLKDAVNG